MSTVFWPRPCFSPIHHLLKSPLPPHNPPLWLLLRRWRLLSALSWSSAPLSPNGSHIAEFSVSRVSSGLSLCLWSTAVLRQSVLPVPERTYPGRVRGVNNDNIIVSPIGLLPMATSRWHVTRLIGVNRTTSKYPKLLWDMNGQKTANVRWVPTDGSDHMLVAAQGTIYSTFREFWSAVYRVDVTDGKRDVTVDHYFARQEDRVTLLSSMERFLAMHNPANELTASFGC